MKEVEKKDMPDISGGEVDAYGNPVSVAYPILQVPAPEQPDPLRIQESPAPDAQP